eukprot:scaffold2349_cov407-Prasinococcus_capsulatus_cf.AAC.16
MDEGIGTVRKAFRDVRVHHRDGYRSCAGGVGARVAAEVELARFLRHRRRDHCCHEDKQQLSGRGQEQVIWLTVVSPALVHPIPPTPAALSPTQPPLHAPQSRCCGRPATAGPSRSSRLNAAAVAPQSSVAPTWSVP